MENDTTYKHYAYENQKDFFEFAITAIPKIRKKMALYDKKGNLTPEWQGMTKIELDGFLAMIFRRGKKFWSVDENLDTVIKMHREFRDEMQKLQKERNVPQEKMDEILNFAWQYLKLE